MIPLRKLGDDAEKISVGDSIEVDERTGIVRFIGSGRVQVDFNHRFAGKTILCDVNVVKSLDTDDEKIMGLLKRRLPVDESKLQFKINGTQLDITMPEETFLAEGLQVIKRAIVSDIFKFVSRLEKINFIESYNNIKAEKPQEITAEAKSTEPKAAEPKAA